MERWGFCGPSAQLSSLNAEAERTINFMPVIPDSGTPKKTQNLVHTPGLCWWQTLGDQPIRCCFEQDGRAWVVAGAKVYEVFANGTSTYRGAVLRDNHPATIHSNGTGGTQLLIISAGHGYVYGLGTNVVTLIADIDFPAGVAMGEFMDGYGIVLDRSNQFFLSALEDFTTWDPLDVNQRSQVSDQWQAMLRNHRELWLFGSDTTNVYTDTGDLDIPFEPVPGVLIEQGIRAPYSVKRLDNSFAWVGGDERGDGVVYRANGYTPERISTHTVELFLGQSADLASATAFTYKHEGHSFYQLHVPDLETSWVYDVATKLWHERASWDPVALTYLPHRATTHMFAFGKHVVGDRLTGGLYEYRLDQYEDQLVEAA